MRPLSHRQNFNNNKLVIGVGLVLAFSLLFSDVIAEEETALSEEDLQMIEELEFLEFFEMVEDEDLEFFEDYEIVQDLQDDGGEYE